MKRIQRTRRNDRNQLNTSQLSSRGDLPRCAKLPQILSWNVKGILYGLWLLAVVKTPNIYLQITKSTAPS